MVTRILPDQNEMMSPWGGTHKQFNIIAQKIKCVFQVDWLILKKVLVKKPIKSGNLVFFPHFQQLSNNV
jgi:hypothetical protein